MQARTLRTYLFTCLLARLPSRTPHMPSFLPCGPFPCGLLPRGPLAHPTPSLFRPLLQRTGLIAELHLSQTKVARLLRALEEGYM